MNCQTGVLKDFDSRTEKMGLYCPYGNTEGIKCNDLVSRGQTLVRVVALLLGTYMLQTIVPLCKLGSGHERLQMTANV